jgi:hypothetical protein
MNAQQPSSSGEQEMDLLDIFSLLGRAFNNLMRFFFRIVDYLLKFWWIIILLIIGGAALGYFTKGEPSYKAELLLKTNFKSQAYVYNAINQFTYNIQEVDKDFISSIGGDPENFGISGASVDPIVEVIDIISLVGENDRVLSAMTREFKLEGEKELFATDRFLSNFKYHKLELSLKNEAGIADIKKLLDYINKQPFAIELKEKGIANHNDLISQSEKTVNQVDELVEIYKQRASLAQNSEDRIYVNTQNDNGLQELLDFKILMARNNEELKNDSVSATDVAVIVSDIQAYPDKSWRDKKELIYPIILIAGFLLFAGLFNLYKKYSETQS